ncbi:MAG: ribonuclease HII [Candidatus Andersenbacteria bacterium]
MSPVGIATRKRTVARASFRLENQLYRAGYQVVAGLDEVGVGAWAGPVVAAACILPRTLSIGTIFDSKSLTKLQRRDLQQLVVKKSLSFGIGEASAQEVERFGMTQALKRAYVRAVGNLTLKPDVLLLDGREVRGLPFEHRAVVDADQKCKCVAAASIIAKEYRDALMTRLAPEYPAYGFEVHKGYGTPQHQRALLEHGISPIHRKSYRWIQQLLAGTTPDTAATRVPGCGSDGLGSLGATIAGTWPAPPNVLVPPVRQSCSLKVRQVQRTVRRPAPLAPSTTSARPPAARARASSGPPKPVTPTPERVEQVMPASPVGRASPAVPPTKPARQPQRTASRTGMAYQPPHLDFMDPATALRHAHIKSAELSSPTSAPARAS